MNIPPVTPLPDLVSPTGAAPAAPTPQGRSAEEHTQVQAQAQPPRNEQIRKMVAELQDRFGSMSISVNFTTYGADDEKIAVVVSDQKTGKVIREIPSEELQKLYIKMNELIGMIFNGSA